MQYEELKAIRSKRMSETDHVLETSTIRMKRIITEEIRFRDHVVLNKFSPSKPESFTATLHQGVIYSVCPKYSEMTKEWVLEWFDKEPSLANDVDLWLRIILPSIKLERTGDAMNGPELDGIHVFTLLFHLIDSRHTKFYNFFYTKLLNAINEHMEEYFCSMRIPNQEPALSAYVKHVADQFMKEPTEVALSVIHVNKLELQLHNLHLMYDHIQQLYNSVAKVQECNLLMKLLKSYQGEVEGQLKVARCLSYLLSPYEPTFMKIKGLARINIHDQCAIMQAVGNLFETFWLDITAQSIKSSVNWTKESFTLLLDEQSYKAMNYIARCMHRFYLMSMHFADYSDMSCQTVAAHTWLVHLCTSVVHARNIFARIVLKTQLTLPCIGDHGSLHFAVKNLVNSIFKQFPMLQTMANNLNLVHSSVNHPLAHTNSLQSTVEYGWYFWARSNLEGRLGCVDDRLIELHEWSNRENVGFTPQQETLIDNLQTTYFKWKQEAEELPCVVLASNDGQHMHPFILEVVLMNTKPMYQAETSVLINQICSKIRVDFMNVPSLMFRCRMHFNEYFNEYRFHSALDALNGRSAVVTDQVFVDAVQAVCGIPGYQEDKNLRKKFTQLKKWQEYISFPTISVMMNEFRKLDPAFISLFVDFLYIEGPWKGETNLKTGAYDMNNVDTIFNLTTGLSAGVRLITCPSNESFAKIACKVHSIIYVHDFDVKGNSLQDMLPCIKTFDPHHDHAQIMVLYGAERNGYYSKEEDMQCIRELTRGGLLQLCPELAVDRWIDEHRLFMNEIKGNWSLQSVSFTDTLIREVREFTGSVLGMKIMNLMHKGEEIVEIMNMVKALVLEVGACNPCEIANL